MFEATAGSPKWDEKLTQLSQTPHPHASFVSALDLAGYLWPQGELIPGCFGYADTCGLTDHNLYSAS